MSASPVRLHRLRRQLSVEPALAANGDQATALLADLGSTEPAAELAALGDWFEAADPRALPWPRGRRAALIAPSGFAGGEVIDEALGAALVAHRWIDDNALSPSLVAARFRPRRDPLIAAAVRLLPSSERAFAVVRLLDQAGPRETELHLSLLQSAEAIAGAFDGISDELLDRVTGELLTLFEARAPRPLLDRLAPVLGAFAGRAGPGGDRVLAEIIARLEGAAAIVGRPEQLVPRRSFVEQVRGLDEGTIPRDEGYFRALPHRQLRDSGAEALGRAGADRHEARRFGDLLAALPEGEDDDLFASFLEGVAASPDSRELTELLRPLLSSGGKESGLALVVLAEHPLDDQALRDGAVAALGEEDPLIQALAVPAADALGLPSELFTPLARGPSIAVARAAARVLARRGESIDWPAESSPRGARRRALVLGSAGLGDPAIADALLEELTSGDGDSEETQGALGSWIAFAPGGAAWLVDQLRLLEPPLLPILSALATAGEPPVPYRVADDDLAAIADALQPHLSHGGEAGLAAALLLARLAPASPTVIDWLEQAWAMGDLPLDASLVATLYAQTRVRDPRAAARIVQQLPSADLPTTMFAVLALALTLDDASVLHHIEDAATFGSHGATTSYNGLVAVARDRPDLL